MSGKAVTRKTMAMARAKHLPLPVPSAEDLEAMRKIAGEKVAQRIKKPKGDMLTKAECERAVTEAAKMGIDKGWHTMWGALLMAGMSARYARKILRCTQDVMEMYEKRLITDYDIEKQMQEEWNIRYEKKRTWGLKK